MRLSSAIANALLALVYAGVFAACYAFFLYFYFGYTGFELYSRDVAFWILTGLLCALPVLFYRGHRSVSSVIAVLTYILLYIPIIITFAFGSARAPGEIILVQAVLGAGMVALFVSDWIAIRNPFDLDTGLDLVRWALVFTIIGTAYMVFVYRTNLRFVSFGEAVYEQRSANVALGSDLLTRYLSSWLGSVLVPLCLAYGLVAGRYKYFVAGTVSCVVFYMATAAKIMILLPFVFVGFYIVFRAGRLKRVYSICVLSLSALLVYLLAVTKVGTVTFLVSSILIHRTIGGGGQVTMAYYDFFTTHPQTDYTHINVVQMLTGAYPYGTLLLGQVVGQYYWSPDMNANANFWATDGFAALGLLGVGTATAGCALVFVILNSLTRSYNQLFVALCFLPFIVSLLNTSLFSSMWSGGGFFLLLFFLFNRRDGRLATRQRGPEPAPSPA